ncbi:HD domain-containing phosphohydrolase [Hyalangium rubrum]|uniref:HD domain-containing phosphohydrolase n=1 Tax=Hyalangium rubrum TaxID=3103134 RepID=A0ABU5H6L0_9BACT|nr:HD domain-containing phosphohydrolase [Hyalangium sp. s54d21]MDY7228757.1 HD domain-containing phosphohydrolase [Hyalangium sp. s54d21]
MRLFKAILLLMLVASIIPTLMVGWLSVSHTRELLVRDAQELAQERVKQLRLKLDNLLSEPTEAVVALTNTAFFTHPPVQQRALLGSVLSQHREVLAITVFTAQGERMPGLQAFAVNDLPPTAVAEHEARARALLQGLTGMSYAEVVHQGPQHVPVLTLAFPVGEPVKGYIAADLSLAGLQELLLQERVGSSGFFYVTDRHGHLLAGGAALGENPDISQRGPVEHLLRQLTHSPDSEHFHVGNFGKGKDATVAAYTVLPELGWAIVSEQPVVQAYHQVGSMERRILMALGGAILVALVLAAVFSRNLTRPLKNFTAKALELAGGKFGAEVEIRQKNELGELAQTFNYMSKQLMAYDMENRRLYESLEQGYLETIVALANSIDSKDAYTRGHSQRVGDVAVEIGRELTLPERQLKQLQYGGILHDIGKIGIVESILCKQSRLTDAEMAIMREHPAIGDSIIGPVSFLTSVRACVRSHHERWDGSGYPDKLKGEEIPMLARIVACADTFDACTSTRPYQKAMPLEQAMQILDKLSGAQLDPKVVEALRRVLQKKGVRLEGHRQPVKLAS